MFAQPEATRLVNFVSDDKINKDAPDMPTGIAASTWPRVT
jgi:hypothetical protein